MVSEGGREGPLYVNKNKGMVMVSVRVREGGREGLLYV